MLGLCIAAVTSSCTDGSLNLNGVLVAKGERPEIELCPGFIHYVATLEEGDGYPTDPPVQLRGVGAELQRDHEHAADASA